MKKRKMKRKIKKWIYIVVLCCLIFSFFFTFFKFIKLSSNYNKTVHLVEDLQEDIPADVPIFVVDEDGEEKEVYTRDFAKLKSINSDTVGWIEVEDSSINYPIVQTKDNTYYLTHSFNKKKNVNGWVFMNMGSSSHLSDQNTVIFAHDSIFKDLATLYKAKNKKDVEIKIYQEDKVVIYEIFSLYMTTESDVTILENKLSSYFIEDIIRKSKFDYGVSVKESDSILTLSTCYNGGAKRVILHAKKVS